MAKKQARGGMAALRKANREIVRKVWQQIAGSDPYSKKTDKKVAKELTKLLGVQVSAPTWQRYRMEQGLVSCRRSRNGKTPKPIQPHRELTQERVPEPGKPCSLQEMKQALVIGEAPRGLVPSIPELVKQAIDSGVSCSVDYGPRGGVTVNIGTTR